MDLARRNDFLLEKRLNRLSPGLHRRLSNTIFFIGGMLTKFLTRFPNFTDHSILHSMSVLNYCNNLIGAEQVERLSAEECFVLIMTCLLHDIGMGVDDRDFLEFSEQIDFGDYFETHDPHNEMATVRDFHNEYSGLFIRKYAEFFDIPNEELTFSIVQAARGHRKLDLFDATEYPDIDCDGHPIRTSYISSIVRLADEIDVATDRNPELLFHPTLLTDKTSIRHFALHECVREVIVEPDAIVMRIKPVEPDYAIMLEVLSTKLRNTLRYCRSVVRARSDFEITQTELLVFDGKRYYRAGESLSPDARPKTDLLERFTHLG